MTQPKNPTASLFRAVMADGALGCAPARLQKLIGWGADVQARKNGYTPLLYAAFHGHGAAVGLLLDAGADIEARTTESGHSPLYEATRKGHAAICAQLLAAGANPDVLTDYKRTPLMMAAICGHADIARMLLEKGAQTASLCHMGYDAAAYARVQKHPAIAAMIREYELRHACDLPRRPPALRARFKGPA